MPKFIVKETEARWVIWHSEVEAASAEEAADLYRNGVVSRILDPEIGDTVDSLGTDLEVEKAT